MSDKDVLGGIALASVVGPIGDLKSNLAGKKVKRWFAAFKRFLRGMNPWPEVHLWRAVNETTIEVNLDAPPMLPFPDATVEWIKPGQTGWVRVERRGDKLFVNGLEVLLHLTEGQKTGTVHGHDLRKQLEGRVVLHPNVADALFENVHLIPDSWKVDDQGRTICVYFWAVGYRSSNGHLYVRCLCWFGGQWRWGLGWLDNKSDAKNPAAILAS